jgi:hypothetical protein
MSDINLDVNEITGPMFLQREMLLGQADEADKQAVLAREAARDEAAKVLQRGEEAAESWEGSAARKRAYADRWSVIIAREESEAGVTVDPTPTLTDGQLDASGVAGDA